MVGPFKNHTICPVFEWQNQDGNHFVKLDKRESQVTWGTFRTMNRLFKSSLQATI